MSLASYKSSRILWIALLGVMVLSFEACKKEEEFEIVEEETPVDTTQYWVFAEQFTSNSDWELSVNDSLVPTSAVGNGNLHLSSSQGTGCVRKRLKRPITIPSEFRSGFWSKRVEIEIDLVNYDQNAMGYAHGYLDLGGKRITISFTKTNTPVKAKAIVENDTIVIETDLDEKDQSYPGVYFIIEEPKETGDQIQFLASACGADLYAAASIHIQHLRIRRFL
ncbi:hypothetical protein KFE98_01935 [bacterium SCSIO 12741]|nr:hypothetical protein KFE98_01935 [bacterium SCSIO 12741]